MASDGSLTVSINTKMAQKTFYIKITWGSSVNGFTAPTYQTSTF